MAFRDKTGALARMANGENVVLELGCGPNKRDAASIGIDRLDYPGVDLVGDVLEVLSALPAGSIHAVATYHFVEHVADLERLLDELARVMRRGSVLTMVVPHFANPYFYSDPTHTRFFGLYTFSYLAEDTLFRREVPRYGRVPAFALADVRLGFTSPFFGRRLVRRLFGALFNLSRWLQEFHEENLCYVFPCYELRFELRRL